MKLTIIIPVYNEARTISELIRKVKSVKLVDVIRKEIIIINDGSTDGTTQLLRNDENDSAVNIFHLPRNQGKAEALKLGIAHATGDIILFQDADLEYDPSNYPQLLEPFLLSNAAIVFGSRFKGTIKKMSPLIWIANRLTNLTVNVLFKTQLTDVNTCYKLGKSEIIKNIKMTSKRFVCEAEITCALLKQGYSITEVPITYHARTKKEGKKLTWLEAIKMYFGFIFYTFESDTKQAGATITQMGI